MFSFFKKPVIAPENVPLPESPPRSRVIQESDPSQVASGSHVRTQLRTPSPSIASGSAANGAHPSPAPTVSTTSNRGVSPTRPIEASPGDVPLPTPTPESLSALISSVPAKILYVYTLSRIPDASEDTIKTLAAFFDTLAPPPKLHCLRCHKDFVEVENDDRSCLVPHDDDSAEVERVGRGVALEARRTAAGTEYETLWGCCGKITEGNGDQGPPDGFCYEGKHTTDVKRARFRADSTPQDDKLVSCLRHNCHGIRDTMPRSARKRARPRVTYKESDDDNGSEGEADSGMEEMVKKSTGKAKPQSKAQPKGKGKAKEVEEDKMDVDEEGEGGEPDSASRAGSVRGKGKSKAKPPANPATPSSVPKRRGRPPKAKAPTKDSDVESVAASVKSAPATTKRRGRQPKSKMYVSDSEEEREERGRSVGPRGNGSKPVSVSGSPSRAPPTTTGPPRTRSQSRTRVQAMVSRLEASATTITSVPKTPLKPTSSRAKAAETEVDEEEAQPKKRRKVAS
ncbi:hypothetical protein BXZ70DRAFT_945552 [Cristinia sonorae]|uniref:Uncharacterized protein n=1 Tax=Cristinia sonorae TaxID=1940300 RepID=A0A8K0ULH2_9AGAR|nr:hypothetical protein BXZ70DRAFT_945552 [Cristinia sonorae]